MKLIITVVALVVAFLVAFTVSDVLTDEEPESTQVAQAPVYAPP